MIEEKLYVRPEVYTQYEAAMKHDYFSSKKLNINEIENGIILPAIRFTCEKGFERYKGGVITNSGEFVVQSAHYRENLDAFWGTLIEGYSPQGMVKIDGREVIYGGILHEHFGHFLIESSGRLWYWLTIEKKYPIAFIALGKVKKFVYDFLKIVGIDTENILIITEATQFRKVIVPESSFVIRNYYTKEFTIPYQNNHISPGQFNRIYLTRRHFKDGPQIFGEDCLEKVFAENGYKVIAPEQYSLEEQISFIKGAKSIAGIMGTATHLALFAAPETELILLNRSDDLNNNQIMVNQAKKLKVFRIDAHQNFLPVNHTEGPFIMGITDCLVRFFHDKKYNIQSTKFNPLSSSIMSDILNEWLRIYSQSHYFWLPETFKPYVSRAIYCFKPHQRKAWYRFIYKHKNNETHHIFKIFGIKFRFKKKLKI